jgi:hypothetical protein
MALGPAFTSGMSRRSRELANWITLTEQMRDKNADTGGPPDLLWMKNVHMLSCEVCALARSLNSSGEIAQRFDTMPFSLPRGKSPTTTVLKTVAISLALTPRLALYLALG